MLLINFLGLMMKKYLSPGQIIALGFFTIIMIGSLLILLPISQKDPGSISFTDAMFTATSAVCVTGLTTIEAGSQLTAFGQTVLALLIQLGGLGFASISIGILMLSGHKVFLKQQNLVKESLNYGSLKGIVPFVKTVLLITFIFEFGGALFFFFIFSQYYSPLKAIGISLFHAVSSFNNAGFDIFGKGNSIVSYNDNAPLLIVTALLIIFGGLGYLVIKEVAVKHRFKKFSLHTKVVLCTTISLLLVGTLAFMITEDYNLLNAFFMSTSTRTAGFTSVDLSNISNAGLIIYIALMFIGASPSSTGGGIKTTTFFIVLTALYTYSSTNKPILFKRSLQKDILYKAFIIFCMGICVVLVSLFLVCAGNPELPFKDLLFETVSAFGTTGLSTGITSRLSTFSKYVIIATMYTGRIGPLTIASIWFFKKRSSVSYAEESLTLG